MRFLFYSHDGMGLGHTRRHLAIASALTEIAPDASIMIATGADEVNRLGLPPNVEVLKLPSLRKLANEEYVSRRLRIPTSEIRALRSALLLAAVKAFKPTLVLVDKHPFGAGGEFKDALEQLRSDNAVTVLGLRDILDTPETVLREWAPHRLQERITESYDHLLIYGQRAVFDPVKEYNFLPELAKRTLFCGYIANRPESGSATSTGFLERSARPTVLATAGGGEDGYFVLETFARAALGAPWRGVIVAGPMLAADEFGILQRMATEGNVALHSFVPDLSNWFWSVDALVCMGGYNTLAEALCTGVPTVCVPRIRPRREQFIRAKAFERLGMLRCVTPDDLTPAMLRQAISSALTMARHDIIARTTEKLNFDGARQAASHLLILARERRNPVPLKAVLAS